MLVGAAAFALVVGGVGAVVYSAPGTAGTSATPGAKAPTPEPDGSLRSLSVEMSPDSEPGGPGSPGSPGSPDDGDQAVDAVTGAPRVDRLTRKTHVVEGRGGKLVRVSRDVDSADLKKQADLQARQRMIALQALAQAAQDDALKLGVDQWVLPLAGYRISAGFGESGQLWASTHSGQDFAAAEGTPLVAMGAGVVTRAGYDSATRWAGKLTVLRLKDGTELWYAHQSNIRVRVGDAVEPGQVIGEVGTTGNSTGPHLHLEVRPGGADPIDPRRAFAEHGISV